MDFKHLLRFLVLSESDLSLSIIQLSFIIIYYFGLAIIDGSDIWPAFFGVLGMQVVKLVFDRKNDKMHFWEDFQDNLKMHSLSQIRSFSFLTEKFEKYHKIASVFISLMMLFGPRTFSSIHFCLHEGRPMDRSNAISAWAAGKLV